MKLIIEGREIFAGAQETLFDLCSKLGLIKGSLKTDPIVAKIAGRIFTLNYIPVRDKDISEEKSSIRTAMAASGGIVSLIRYTDPSGRDAYTRTAQFAIFLALERAYPGAVGTMNTTIGQGLYFKVKGAEGFSARRLKEELSAIAAEAFPLYRRRIATSELIAYYEKVGQEDKAELLSYRKKSYIDVYEHEGFIDYFYGEMAPTVGYLGAFDIIDAEDGFIFIYPDKNDPERVADFKESPNFFKMSRESKDWGELMACETVADLNLLTASGRIRELIRVNEALHEKKFSEIADEICERGAKAVLLAGPSSSGKTTSANRLATQLRVHGKAPVLMSLDDYYIDRHLLTPDENGKVDLEHINTIDTALFREHLKALLSGEEVEIPSFNFKKGAREWVGHKLKLNDRSVIIIEGIHGLNPMLLPTELDKKLVFRLFISPLLPLFLDYHNRIPTSYLRLLRRTVRDFESRGASVQKTLSMWDSVRRGEERWIFPFQENADVILNSSTLYELAVLKKHIYPLLTAIDASEECYDQVRGMVKILNYVIEADVDDEIPPTSIVREFIGGNSFYKK